MSDEKLGKEKKIRMGKCEECTIMVDALKLYVVRDRRLCQFCGNKEIQKWNSLVSEFS